CFPPISPPTQKYSPLAVTTRTSTAGSRSASTAAFLMPWYISMVSALRRSGRSITTRNTPSPFLACRWREPRSTDVMPGSSDDLGAAQLGDLRGREAELAQHVVRVLADDGREPLDADRVPGHLDRRPEDSDRAAARVLGAEDEDVLHDLRVLEDVLERVHATGRDVVLLAEGDPMIARVLLEDIAQDADHFFSPLDPSGVGGIARVGEEIVASERARQPLEERV